MKIKRDVSCDWNAVSVCMYCIAVALVVELEKKTRNRNGCGPWAIQHWVTVRLSITRSLMIFRNEGGGSANKEVKVFSAEKAALSKVLTLKTGEGQTLVFACLACRSNLCQSGSFDFHEQQAFDAFDFSQIHCAFPTADLRYHCWLPVHRSNILPTSDLRYIDQTYYQLQTCGTEITHISHCWLAVHKSHTFLTADLQYIDHTHFPMTCGT